MTVKAKFWSDHLWLRSMYQRCAWTGFLTFWNRTPAASNRIRSEVFFSVVGSGLDLDFVFTEKTLLVVYMSYIYPDSNKSRIACV